MSNVTHLFDDYEANAKTVDNVSTGNGNLMYTVSHDSSSGRHTVRWERYTSFNMPLEIKYTNIGQTQYQSNLGQVIAATAQYSCPAGVSLSGTQCVTVSTVAATLSYSCASNMQLRNGNQCWARVGWTWRYITGAAPVYSCAAGSTAVGTGSATRCQRTQVHAQAKVVGYSCPAHDQLAAGNQCRGTGGRLIIGQGDAALANSDRTLSFTYGPEHQRVKQVVALSNNAPTSLMSGTTWYLHGENNSLLYEKEEKVNGITEQRHYLQAAGMTFALAVARSGPGLSSQSQDAKLRPTQLSYFQQDHLGSIAVVTDENGVLIEQMAYDPWGKRRYADGKPDTQDSIVGLTTDRGFTEHEHLDEVGVIHMNGRVYDPLIGRFMSADPHVTYPYRLQSYNRYAYVLNNPLRLVDPSGFFVDGESPENQSPQPAVDLGGSNQAAEDNEEAAKDVEEGKLPVLDAGVVYVSAKRTDKSITTQTLKAFDETFTGGYYGTYVEAKESGNILGSIGFGVAAAVMGVMSVVTAPVNAAVQTGKAIFGKVTLEVLEKAVPIGKTGFGVVFGTNIANPHTVKHLDKLAEIGIAKSQVEQAVTVHLANILDNHVVPVGSTVNATVDVDGVAIGYFATHLKDGVMNVGTVFAR